MESMDIYFKYVKVMMMLLHRLVCLVLWTIVFNCMLFANSSGIGSGRLGSRYRLTGNLWTLLLCILCSGMFVLLSFTVFCHKIHPFFNYTLFSHDSQGNSAFFMLICASDPYILHCYSYWNFIYSISFVRVSSN